MTLGKILDLNLHEFSADVEEICDQALKEAKMEAGLEVLEAYWSKAEWFTELYKVPHQDDGSTAQANTPSISLNMN